MLLKHLLLAALPALAAAQDQQPLLAQAQKWFEQAKSYLPESFKEPVNSGAAAFASRHVTELTPDNWQELLAPSATATGPENWMVLVTGGNKTCPVRCDGVDAAFNKSAALLAADPRGPKVGRVDCDANGRLCSTWLAAPPSVWYIQVPGPVKPDQTKAETPIYVVPVNVTTVTAADLTAIHTEKKYLSVPKAESPYFHPFDGMLAQYGLSVPFGWVHYGFSQVPSWTFMLAVSFITRTMMNRRMAPPTAAGQRPAGGAAAPPPAAAGR